MDKHSPSQELFERRYVTTDYLERKGGETLSILTAEYDFDTAIAVKQEEAYAEGVSFGFATGREEGISIGLEQGLERGLEQGRLEGLECGAHQKALETAKAFLSMGFSPQQVAQGTGLPLETVQQLIV